MATDSDCTRNSKFGGVGAECNIKESITRKTAYDMHKLKGYVHLGRLDFELVWFFLLLFFGYFLFGLVFIFFFLRHLYHLYTSASFQNPAYFKK